MSSSAETPGIAGLLAESLVCLEREAPGCHARLATRLAGYAFDLTIGERRMALRGDGVRISLGPACDAPVHVQTSLAVILAVLDGDLSFVAAVRDDRLDVRGPLTDLLVLHGALADYVHGAVRSPSFPRLLHRLRTLATRETGTLR